MDESLHVMFYWLIMRNWNYSEARELGELADCMGPVDPMTIANADHPHREG